MKANYWQDDYGKSWYDWREEALVLDPNIDPTNSPLTYEDVLLTTSCVQKEIEEQGYTLEEYTELLHEAYLEIYEEIKEHEAQKDYE